MKTVVFDFDGTLTKKSHEIWEKMWSAIGASDIDYKLYMQYKNGDFDYSVWCAKIEEEYKTRGFSERILKEVSKDIELMDNIEYTLKTLVDNGYKLYIISGGADKVIYDKLKHLVGYFEGITANVFNFDNHGFLDSIIATKYDDEGKRHFIEEYCKETGTKPDEITFVGNGDNDEYVYLSGCKTICINPTNKTDFNNRTIWHQVVHDTTNLVDILKYFGL